MKLKKERDKIDPPLNLWEFAGEVLQDMAEPFHPRMTGSGSSRTPQETDEVIIKAIMCWRLVEFQLRRDRGIDMR